MDNAGQRALKKVEEAGGGEYTTVNTGDDLRRHLEEEYERLRDEWDEWGVDSWLDASAQWSEKYTVLSEAHNVILDKVLREKDRMLNAQEYLESSKKVQDDRALYDKIWRRSKLVDRYLYKKYRTLSDLLSENESKEKQRVEEKAKDMEKKYEQ